MSKIGLLSDSHGHAAVTRAAVALLVELGAERLVHLGDVGTLEVLDAMLAPRPGTDEPVAVHVVFGNTDWDTEPLQRYSASLGLEVGHPMGRLSVAGGVLAYCHGHEAQRMEQALGEGVRYLCHGHTHQRRDEQMGPTRVINPGALHRAALYTVALLEPEGDVLSFHEVNGRSVG